MLDSIEAAIKEFADNGGIGQFTVNGPDGGQTVVHDITSLIELQKQYLGRLAAEQNGSPINYFRPGGV